MEVNIGCLTGNLGATRGLILGEAVMLALGDQIGRLEAHHFVEQASRKAVQTGRTLYDVLVADPSVTAHLDAARLQALLDPANYVGKAHAFVDAVLAGYDASVLRSSTNHHEE